jgi:type 1 glutamine amidotransferase
VKVLLRSDHATSDGPVAWISPYEKSRVVYLQLGHDRNANLNPNFQRLVRNAIYWAAGKTNAKN